MQHLIETPRLLIRPLTMEDEDGMFEMDSDPEVHRYLGGKYYKSIEESRENIRIVRQQYDDHGIGRWAVLDKSNGEFLGWVGFKFMTDKVNGHVHHYDFGYRLKSSAWGKGIASEAGKASLEYGLNEMKLQPVYAMTDVANSASRRVLEKLGFQLKGTFIYDGPLTWRTEDDLETTWYEWQH